MTTQNPESALHERLYSTDNAAVWAGEFVALHGGDEGLMIGWFANAIETAKRIDRDRHPERKPVMDRDFAVLSRSALLQFFGEMALLTGERRHAERHAAIRGFNPRPSLLTGEHHHHRGWRPHQVVSIHARHC